ncbi:GNAT family N-acetyltransferase [Nocardia vinacea]|uniref:GNAT family N-acetyltransferase n=1 Tax=Nocardia vinacea TaxID=96468 RepID=A0ABZ1YR60_9NOCA|nr:GNAT family N-acetyltransferase [Nocardia vinacea]
MPHRLSTDRTLLDIEIVWAHLSTGAYWSGSRTRDEVEDEFTAVWRVVTAHDSATGALVGFARAMSDGTNNALLADVFVVPAHRGRGLGKQIVDHMIRDGPGSGFGWILFTRDAHSLYERFGFKCVDAATMIRPPQSMPRSANSHGTARDLLPR